MQSYKFDEVIKRTCEKNDLDYDLMKSFSDHIFSTTKQEMTRFEHLRIYLRGFVSWFYGRPRLRKVLSEVQKKEAGEESFFTFVDDATPERLEELRNKTENLLTTYEEYISNKAETKKQYRLDKYGPDKED